VLASRVISEKNPIALTNGEGSDIESLA
jgi:hypothetical protein